MNLQFLIHLHKSPASLTSNTLGDPLLLAGLDDAMATTPLKWTSSILPDRHANRHEETSMSIKFWQEIGAVAQPVTVLSEHQNPPLCHPVMGALALKSEPVESIPGLRLVRGDTNGTEVFQ